MDQGIPYIILIISSKTDTEKVIKATLKTSGLFYKEDNSNLFYFKENRVEKSIKSMTKRKVYTYSQSQNCTTSEPASLVNAYSTYEAKSAKNKHMSIQMKIKLTKVNRILSRMKAKYQSDSKYAGVIECIKLFTSLIDKYMLLIKKDKANAVFDLNTLNDKIIAICDKIDAIEGNKTFFPQLTQVYPQIEHLCKMNDIDMTKYDGDNNLFSEPPNEEKGKEGE